MDRHRLKFVEMKLTHTVEITFYVVIKKVESKYLDIKLLDITSKVGSDLYMKIFTNLEKSGLTPENKYLFRQTS